MSASTFDKQFELLPPIPYEAPLVQFTDAVVERHIAAGRHTSVLDQHDWDVIGLMYKGWAILYPEDAMPFEKHIKRMHDTTYRKGGISKEGDAMVQHILEIPAPLYKMIVSFYPFQKWDKKFVHAFAEHFPGMRGYGT